MMEMIATTRIPTRAIVNDIYEISIITYSEMTMPHMLIWIDELHFERIYFEI